MSWAWGAIKAPDLDEGCIVVSYGADSDACCGEPAIAAGYSGRGKMISSNTAVGSDIFSLGSAEALGCLVSTP